MGLKKMLIALAVAFVAVLGLGLFVVLVDMKGKTTEEVLEARGLVFQYEDAKNRTIPDVATKLEIARGDEQVVLEKTDALHWRLRKPVDARADRSAVLAILTDIKNLRIESTVEPKPDQAADADPFGLKKPRVTAAFWLGDTRHELLIGSEVKGARDYEKKAYVQVAGSDSVYVVDNPLVDKVDKKAADFRDKHVFERTRDPEKATAVRVIGAKPKLALELKDKAWRLTAPVADLADDSKVTSLLSKARNLDVQDYVSEDPAKLADYGLDKPQLTCELVAADDATMTLLVGSKAKDDEKKLYAKRGEEPSIFTINADFVADIRPSLDDLRQRKVADLAEDDVTRVELTRGGATWAVARKNRDDDWKLAKPREADAQASAVDDFLRDLKKLRVARWVDDPKKTKDLLKKPEATIAVTREPEGKPGANKKPSISLTIGPAVKTDKEQGRYLQRQGQSGLLFVSAKKPDASASYDEKDSVDALEGIGESLGRGYLDFLDRSVFDFQSDDVTRLVIQRGKLKLVCEKDGETWRLTQPTKLDCEKSNIDAILGAMHSLQADRFVAESPKDLKPFGLDAPALRLTATVAEEAKDKPKDDDEKKPEAKDDKKKPKEKPKKTYTRTLLVSRTIDGEIHAMAEGGKLVFSLKSWDATSLRTEPIKTKIGDFAEADAQAVTLAHRGKPEIELTKQDGTWSITKPAKAEADPDAAKKIIDALHDLEARRYLDYDAKDLKPYGLAPPGLVVTVKVKDKPDFVLRIGKPVPGEKLDPGSYAIAGDAKQVFLMARTKLQDVARPLSELEKKKPEPKKDNKKAAPKPPAKKGGTPKATKPKPPTK